MREFELTPTSYFMFQTKGQHHVNSPRARTEELALKLKARFRASVDLDLSESIATKVYYTLQYVTVSQVYIRN